MRAKPRDRGNGDSALEAALRAFVTAMDGAGVPWAVIGGLAVIVHGVRRLTTDVDAVVAGEHMTPAQALRALAAHDIAPRIEDAEAFAETSLVLLVRHRPSGVDIDLSFGWTEFERVALGERSAATFGRVRAPFVRAVDLVVYKGLAGRAKDLEDLGSLLLLHPELDLTGARRRLAELATAAEVPEILTGFDAIVESVRPAAIARDRESSSRSPKPAPVRRPHARKKSRR